MKIENNFKTMNTLGNNNFNNKTNAKNLFNANGLFNNKAKKAGPAYSTEITGIHDIMNKDLKKEKITKKIARGEKLSPEEQEELKEIDPEAIRKAQTANKRREEIRSRLKSSKDKDEAKAVLMEAKMEALSAMDSKNVEY